MDTKNRVSDCEFLYICYIKRHYIRKKRTKLYACYHEYTQMNFLFEWPILQVAHSVRTKRSRDKAAATKPIFADVDIYNGASEWVQFEIYYRK